MHVPVTGCKSVLDRKTYHCEQVATKLIDKAGFEHPRSIRLMTDKENEHVSPSIRIVQVSVESVAPAPNRIMCKSNLKNQRSFVTKQLFHLTY